MAIDHMGFGVGDYPAARRFYEAALGPLGIAVVLEGGEHGCGLGRNGKPDIWLAPGGAPKTSGGDLHLAFSAERREQVDAFHAAALAAGGRDNGPPGLRPQYHPDYYAAFVHDADGNNLEAVCHSPGDAADQKTP